MNKEPQKNSKHKNQEIPQEKLEKVPESDDLTLSVKETKEEYSSDTLLTIRLEIKDSLEKSLVDHAEVWEALSKL